MKRQINKLNKLADKLEKQNKEIIDYVIKITNNPFNFVSRPTPENLRQLAKNLEGKSK